MIKLAKTTYVLIQFKIKRDDGLYRSISYIQKTNNKNFELIFSILKEFWQLKSEEYHIRKVNQVIFTYIIIPDDKLIEKKNKINKPSDLDTNQARLLSEKIFEFNGQQLPLTMDIKKWAPEKNIHIDSDYKKAKIYKPNSEATYYVSIYEKYSTIDYKIKNVTLFSFTDEINDIDNLSTFTRIINNQIFHIINGEIVVKKLKRNNSFMKKLYPSIFRSNKFITMDLETRIINKIMEPICVSLYNGSEFTSFFIKDFINSNDMIKVAIQSLMFRKYNGYKIYLHNFSHFDGVFLLKIISELSDDIKPIIRDNKIINISLNMVKLLKDINILYLSEILYFYSPYP